MRKAVASAGGYDTIRLADSLTIDAFEWREQDMADKEDRAFGLHLEEYKTLRAEIDRLQHHRFTTGQFGIAGVVAVWAYLLSLDVCTTPALFVVLGWTLPVLLAVGGVLLTRHASLSIRHGGAYLAMIEQRYADKALAGWHNLSARIRAGNEDGSEDQADREEGWFRKETAAERWFWSKITPEPDTPMLRKLAGFEGPGDEDVRDLYEVLRERSTNPRLSETMDVVWKQIFRAAVLVAIVGIVGSYFPAPECASKEPAGQSEEGAG